MTTALRDYYQVLGLTKTASQDDIRKAYRRLARKLHPDLHPGPQKGEMEQKFKELNEAYEVLRDEEKRRKYDQFGPEWKEAEAYQRARQQAEATQADRGGHTVFTQGEPKDFTEFFENLFGRQPGPQGPSFRGFSMPGADLETPTLLILREVFTGTNRRLEIPDPSGNPYTIDVRIPKGVGEGERVRVKGKGMPGQGGAPRGDLYLRIHLKPHPVFQRHGSDLFVNLPVWPWEAALGAEVQVPTLTGPVKLKIPPGSHAKQKLRLKGKGLPNRSGSHGDQFAILGIVMPPSFTDQEKALYEQLRMVEHPDPRGKVLREAPYA